MQQSQAPSLSAKFAQNRTHSARGIGYHLDLSINAIHLVPDMAPLPSQPHQIPPNATSAATLGQKEAGGSEQAFVSMVMEQKDINQGSCFPDPKKIRPISNLNPTSSSAKFQSALSLQDEDITLALKVKAVQSVMHAFRTALEILNKLVERRMQDKDGEVYLAAQALKACLDEGSEDISDRHISHFRVHGIRYLEMFTERRKFLISLCLSILRPV